KQPAVFHSLQRYGQGEFFDLFAGASFSSQADRVRFAEALGKLVFWYFETPCNWLPTQVEPAEVQVRCIRGNVEHDLRVFFDLALLDDWRTLSGVVIQERFGAQPSLEPAGH